MNDSDFTDEPRGELDDRLNQAMDSVLAEPVPRDIRNRVIERAVSWTPASVPQQRAPRAEATSPKLAATATPVSLAGRGHVKWYPMVAAALAASLLLAVGLVALHTATKDRSVDAVATNNTTAEDRDTVDPSMSPGTPITLEYARSSVTALVADNVPIIVANGRDKPVQLGDWLPWPSGGTSVHVWDWSRSAISRIAMADAEWFRSDRVALSPDGKLLVRAGGEIIEIASGDRKPIDLGGAVYERPGNTTYSRIGEMQFSPDGGRLAILVRLPPEADARLTDFVQLIEFPTGRVLFQVPASESYQLRVAFSSDGKQVVGGETDEPILVHKQITRRDTTTGEVLRRYEPVIEKQVIALAISPDGRFVAASEADGDVYVWEADSGRLAHRIKTTFHESVGWHATVDAIRFSPDSKLLATSEDGLRVYLHDTATGHLVRELSGVYASKHLRWSNDGKTLTAVADVGLGHRGVVFGGERFDVYPTVQEWDWQSGKLIRSLSPPER